MAGAGDARQRAAGRLHPAPGGAGRPGRHHRGAARASAVAGRRRLPGRHRAPAVPGHRRRAHRARPARTRRRGADPRRGRRRRPRVRAPDQADRRPAHRRLGAAAGGRGGLVGRRDRARRVPPRRPQPGADGDPRGGAGAHPHRRRRSRDRRRRRGHPAGPPGRPVGGRGRGRRQGPVLGAARRPDRGRHDGAGHRRRRGLRRLRPADPACAARRHRGRDAGPPRRRAVPRGLDGSEGRVRAALRRRRRAPVDHHLARTPAGRTGRQGGHPYQRPP